MNKISIYIFILLWFTAIIPGFVGKELFAQQQEYMTVVGDTMVGRMVNGETLREVSGHVVLTQGNVRITCQHAIQYISRNDAELIGDVVAVQDTLTITTSRGFYHGNERKAESFSGVTLYDKKVTLTADTGSYFFNENRAVFLSNVRLVDTSSILTSKVLIYYRAEGKSIAVGNVKIVESGKAKRNRNRNIIYADSLDHFSESGITIAENHVRIFSQPDNKPVEQSRHVGNTPEGTSEQAGSIIFGDHLEDYPKSFYTLVNKNPLYIQIDSSYIAKKDTAHITDGNDTTKILKLDTLVIKSLIMEAFRDTINIFKAKDSVRIVRGTFASNNDFTEYFRNKGKIITYKINMHSNIEGTDSGQPVVWNEGTQLTGDSVAIYLVENKINLLEVYRDAFILSQDAKYITRYNQISGIKLIIHFNDEGIQETDVYGGVHSIYYLYDNNEPNGLTKSSSEWARIMFANKRVDEVKLYGSPSSEFYPENKVQGSELSFTLPGYILYNNKPEKEEILQNYFGAKNFDTDK